MILVTIINGLKLNTSQLSSAILEAVNLFPLAKKLSSKSNNSSRICQDTMSSPQMMIFNSKLILQHSQWFHYY